MEKPVVFFMNEMKTITIVKASYLPCPPPGGSLPGFPDGSTLFLHHKGRHQRSWRMQKPNHSKKEDLNSGGELKPRHT